MLLRVVALLFYVIVGFVVFAWSCTVCVCLFRFVGLLLFLSGRFEVLEVPIFFSEATRRGRLLALAGGSGLPGPPFVSFCVPIGALGDFPYS